MSNNKKVVIFGGTGAQGQPTVKHLAQDGKYDVRIFTRDSQHKIAQELAKLPNVTFVEGSFESEADLRTAMTGMDIVFCNVNGFAIGEKAEVYWSMRAFEIAAQSGVELFVFSSLDSISSSTGYNERYRCAHYDGKSRVAEWMRQQPLDKMKWKILTSGPYMEMLANVAAPKFDETTGVYSFKMPLKDGAIPMIHLNDFGYYARWLIEHDEYIGKELKIATQHIHGPEFAAAFEKATGKKCTYESIPVEKWVNSYAKEDASSAYQVPTTDPAQGQMSWRKNFTGWWQLWQDCGGAHPIVARDYALLDKIHPKRVRSVEEWMKLTNYSGYSSNAPLKDTQDKNGEDRFIRG